jgi:uncharacterized protein (DUF736 family)
MPAIGHVTRKPDGTYEGRLATMTIRQNIQFVKKQKSAEAQPDYLVMASAVEIGAAWWRKSLSGNDYLSVSLAASEFGNRTLYANLGRAAGSQNEEDFALIWNPQD